MFIRKFDFGTMPSNQGYIKVDEQVDYTDELGYGFVYDKDSENKKMITISSKSTDGENLKRDFCYGDKTDVPLRFDVRVPQMGTYNVKILIGDYDADTKVTIQSEWRRFMLSDKVIKKGEFLEYEFTVNVCDVHRKDEERYIDRVLNIAILGDMPKINALIIEQTDVPTIYIAGDSTVTDQTAQYPYNPQSSYCGWGQQLGQFLKKGIAVSNHAQSGLTTQAFMGIHWEVVKEVIKKGDYLFMGFGHNDQKIQELGAFSGYYENLKYYINFVREKGAYPVLCTPINRIIFEDDGSLRDLLGEYGLAVKALAKQENVPCIDLLSKTTEYFVAQGSVRAWDYFWGDGVNRDYTHPNDRGGNVIARFVAQGIVENNIKPLCDFVKKDEINVDMPDKIVVVNRNDSVGCKDKPVEDIGLVNLPKFNDINGIENEEKIKELSAKGYLDEVDTNKFGADSLLTIKSAIYWVSKCAKVSQENQEKIFVGDGIEMSDKAITREEFAILVIKSYNYRAPDRAIVGNIDAYCDRGQISDNALDFVRAANEIGIMRGVSENEYKPKSTMTRNDAIEILYKLNYTK